MNEPAAHLELAKRTLDEAVALLATGESKKLAMAVLKLQVARVCVDSLAVIATRDLERLLRVDLRKLVLSVLTIHKHGCSSQVFFSR